MIAIEQCKEGYLYRLKSRNLTLGVYTAEPRPHFIGIREKFGSRYLAAEYHSDTDPRWGTATPTEELERCWVAELKTQLGLVCRKCDKAMHHEGEIGSIRHVHDQPSECKDDWGWLNSNKPLFDYLKDGEQRYISDRPKGIYPLL